MNKIGLQQKCKNGEDNQLSKGFIGCRYPSRGRLARLDPSNSYLSACVPQRDIQRLPTLLFSVAQGIFWLSTERLSRSTLDLKEEGTGSLYSCIRSLATVTSYIDLSVRIVTKSPKVGPLLIFSISLVSQNMLDAMVQLLTGSKEGFDPLFFGELVECMNSYDIDLVNVQVLNGKWREISKGETH